MVYDVLPTTNLKYDDVRDTLNSAGGSVNNTMSSLFTEAANIDVWSKRKPVRLNVDFCQDFDSSAPNYNATWWKSYNGNCGLIPKRLSGYQDIAENMDGDMNGWIYELPTGGSAAPFRLGDFAGYYKNAEPPYSNLNAPQVVYKDGTKFTVSAMFNPVVENSVGIGDIDAVKNCYFGAYVTKDGMGIRATSDSTNSPMVEFPVSQLTIGEYTVYPFLCTVHYDVEDLEQTCSYYTIPNLSAINIIVKASSITISIEAIRYDSQRKVTYKITVNKATEGNITYRNNWVYLRYANKDIDDPLVSNEEQVKLNDATIGLGSTVIAEGEFTNVNTDLLSNCKVWCSLNSGQYEQSVIPRLDITTIP